MRPDNRIMNPACRNPPNRTGRKPHIRRIRNHQKIRMQPPHHTRKILRSRPAVKRGNPRQTQSQNPRSNRRPRTIVTMQKIPDTQNNNHTNQKKKCIDRDSNPSLGVGNA